MNITLKKRLNFNDLFPEDPKDFFEYLNGISKEDMMKVVPFLLNDNTTQLPVKDLISSWFSDPQISEELINKIGTNYSIIDTTSSLDFLERVIDFKENLKDEKSKTEIEKDLLKAYLLINSEQEQKENNNELTDGNLDFKENAIALLIQLNYHNSDYSNFKLDRIFLNQIYKSIFFFKYLESDEIFEKHLELFYSKINEHHWKEWIKNITSLIISTISNQSKSYDDICVKKDENFESNCMFLDSLILNDSNSIPDYINLRSYPIIKIADGHYRILFKLFLIEKLFKSIQFKFSLEINNEVEKSFKIKDFRAIHCDNFSERTLLYNVLNKSFPQNKKWINLTGDNFLEKGFQGEPDYYVRFKNKVFLFESKDVILKGDEKQSRNYNTIKNALKKKFYKIDNNGSIEKKAVLQIIENIKRIYANYYSICDNLSKTNQIKIYPVIITHDRQFDSLGVNALVNTWFISELEKLKSELPLSNIQQITIINIDTFISYQDTFFQRGVNRLEKYIDEYHYLNTNDDKIKQFYSFSSFINEAFDKKNTPKAPKEIFEITKLLFTN
ncbi:hypothetical protein [Flammeovirga agarivorans]|uniref:Uncharacterized protein n=1 Tax=Flammeovirga agarivorans TaxID=2726742 RepID=A0A7X8SRC1_9BACT|nr:hypothetical protein [Flammeovirga agarivorans]NLR94980.1 hypothetical protein [Flammeovirga agarivorans]